MALPLTPSELDQFEDQLAAAEAQIELMRALAINLKDTSGNDADVEAAAAAATAAIAAALDLAVPQD